MAKGGGDGKGGGAGGNGGRRGSNTGGGADGGGGGDGGKPPNWPSKTDKPSGGRRDNNPPSKPKT